MDPGPEVIKLFPCSTQLSMKFQLLIKTKIPIYADVEFIMLINVKNANNCWHLTFMSRINFVFS